MTQTQREVAIALTAAAITAGALYVAGRLGANEDGIRVKNGSIEVYAYGGFEDDGEKLKTKKKLMACLTLVLREGDCGGGVVFSGAKAFRVYDTNGGAHEFAIDDPLLRKRTLVLQKRDQWAIDAANPNRLTHPYDLSRLTALDKASSNIAECKLNDSGKLDVVLVPTDCP